MALLDIFKRGTKRAGENLESYIGGLLGEDLSQLSDEERKQVRRQGMSAVFDAMARGTTPTQGLAGVAQLAGARLAAKREKISGEKALQDIQQAQAAIAGRLGARGVDVGEQTQLEEVRPMSGMNLPALMASRAGAAAIEASPVLKSMAEESLKPDEYTYQNVSGVGLVAVNKKNPRDVRIVQSERTRAAGPSEQFKILTAAEAAAMGLPPGIVFQQNLRTRQVSPLEGMPKSVGPGETDVRQYNKAKFEVKTARGNIEGFKADLRDIPAYKALTGEGRGRLNSSYTLALSAIRQLQNSGVLNVGELPFLQKALDDPTSLWSIIGSPIKRKELEGQISTVLRQLNQQENILDEQFKAMGGNVPTQQPPPAAGGGESLASGRRGRKPGADAIKRAEDYY